MADEIVHFWRNLKPPGRFLTRCDSEQIEEDDDYTAGRWRDVGDSRAKTKTCQCLRGKKTVDKSAPLKKPNRTNDVVAVPSRERKAPKTTKEGRLSKSEVHQTTVCVHVHIKSFYLVIGSVDDFDTATAHRLVCFNLLAS